MNNIILIGPPGVGKTTVGRLLAKKINTHFYDSDHAISERSGVTAQTIFDIEGEAGFRAREQKIIRELCQLNNVVIATGGGAIENKESRALLAQSGFVVFINASLEQQKTRLKDLSQRPHLQVDNLDVLLSTIKIRREPLYREIADLEITSDGKRPHQILKEIQTHISM